MTAAQHDVAAAAKLVAAVHADDVVGIIRILDEASDDGRLRELAVAVAAQCASVTSEFWDNQDVQQALDLHAMSAMDGLAP